MKKILFLSMSLLFVSLIRAEDQKMAEPSKQAEETILSSQPGAYTHPGILFRKEGVWVGTDYLYNLKRDLGLVVEVIIPSGESLKIEPKDLFPLIVDTFRIHGIRAFQGVTPGSEGLPFFNVLIMIYPVKEGYVALVEGRLYESTTVQRVTLGKDTFLQAITWEKKTLIRTSKEDFDAFLTKTVTQIINSFGERFKVYEKLKAETER